METPLTFYAGPSAPASLFRPVQDRRERKWFGALAELLTELKIAARFENAIRFSRRYEA